MKIAKSSVVDGREVYVIDGAFSKAGLQAIDRRMRRGPYGRTQSSREDTRAYRHFATMLDTKEIMETYVGEALREAIRKCFPGERFVAQRFYSNMRLYGDSAYPHKDVNPRSKDVTVLLFANEKWDLDWGGETLFYDDEGECVMGVVPRPGRLALFRGAITHRAGLVNRECYEPRYTVALKFAAIPRGKPKPRSGRSARLAKAKRAAPRRAAASR